MLPAVRQTPGEPALRTAAGATRTMRADVARSRTLRPSFFSSFTLAQVSRDCRLFFEGLWVEADDEGRLIDSPKMLAGAIFPHDDDVTREVADGWMDDLVRVGAIVRYEAAGGRYAAITHFAVHQRPPHPTPSRLPAPPADTPPRPNSDVAPDDSRDFRESSREARENSRLGLGLGLGSGLGLLFTDSQASESGELLATDAPVPEPPGFDEFWTGYPRKVGKPSALKAWKRIPPTQHLPLTAGLSRWKRYWQASRTAAEHIPHPATWLNDRRWEDEIPTASVGPPARVSGDPLAEYRRRHDLEGA